MRGQKILFSSKSDEWSTPEDFYRLLWSMFGGFTLDPCATPESAKTLKYYTEKDNGLVQSWMGELVFMNPPYSQIGKWMEKAYNSAKYDNAMVVCLVPSRTDTKWWHQYAMKAEEIHFIKGRLKFGGQKNSAPFPSAVVVFRGHGARYFNGPSIFTLEKP